MDEIMPIPMTHDIRLKIDLWVIAANCSLPSTVIVADLGGDLRMRTPTLPAEVKVVQESLMGDT
jgi:hypothetical protein